MSILIYLILITVNTTAEVPAWILATSGFIALAELLLWVVIIVFNIIAFIITWIGERNER